jgi:hypothetical protein
LLRFIVGLFIVLHGLVHLLYAAHSRGLFELRTDLRWPEGSWAFSRLLGEKATRLLASIAYLLAGVGFVAGGIGIFAGQDWWRPVVAGSAAFSAAIMVLFWDGKKQRLSDQGLIAVLINLAILAAVIVLRWPSLGL